MRWTQHATLMEK